MDNALYVGLSRQVTLQHELDIVANNIANVDTNGFKVESLMVETLPKAPAITAGGPRPVKFVGENGVARDFTQGLLRQTGGALDLGIDGQGFFKVQAPGGERYTRDGRFKLDDNGVVTTEAGLPVLDEGGGPITIDPKKGRVTIAEDGTMSQGAEQVGKVGVFKFDDASVLEKTGDNLLRNSSNLQPQAAPEAKVRQGMLESSNVRPVIEITRMLEVTRAYEQVAKMMDSEADLSRNAVQRLGKVN